MKEKKIYLKIKGEKILIKGKELNYLEQFIGLMFKKRNKADILIFNFKKPSIIRIHSLFVFFPFITIFLDEKKNLVDLKLIKPFKILYLPKKIKTFIEIPLNKKNKIFISKILEKFKNKKVLLST
jgi:uncharacterized membrane protein (UPF0127 family)